MGTQPKLTSADDQVLNWRLLTPRAKLETVVVYGVFVAYLVALVKLLLFSRTPGSERSINLIPFASIAHFTIGASPATSRLALSNIIGNVVIFVPLGACLPLMRRQTSVSKNLIVVGAASVAAEIIQAVLAIGVSDIDDVILNCAGGLIGILAFKALVAMLREQARVRTVMAVLSAIAAPIVFFLLFAVRLRLL